MQYELRGWLVGWLVVFNVPSTARSFRDGTPIYCPLRRTWSSINTPFRPGIEPRAVAWQSITLLLSHASLRGWKSLKTWGAFVAQRSRDRLPCDGPGFDSRWERCIYRASRLSQGTVNGGAFSKWPCCWRDVKHKQTLKTWKLHCGIFNTESIIVCQHNVSTCMLCYRGLVMCLT